MSAIAIQIRDAVVAALNAAVAADGAIYPEDDAPFRFGFTARGAYFNDVNLAEAFEGLVVSVVCTGVKSSTLDRDTDGDAVTIEIGVFKRVDREAAQGDGFAEVGTLVEFVENVRDWLRLNPIDGAELEPGAKIEIDPIYDFEKLSKDSVFASVVRVPILAQFET